MYCMHNSSCRLSFANDHGAVTTSIVLIFTDRQIFFCRKKVNPDLFVIEIREICTCIYNIVNLLKSYDNVHSMTCITKIMLTGIAIKTLDITII